MKLQMAPTSTAVYHHNSITSPDCAYQRLHQDDRTPISGRISKPSPPTSVICSRSRLNPDLSAMTSSLVSEAALQEQMSACFTRLSELVPTVRTNSEEHLSTVQLLQHVIDYILDLENSLEDSTPLQPEVGDRCGSASTVGGGSSDFDDELSTSTFDLHRRWIQSVSPTSPVTQSTLAVKSVDS